MFWLINLVKRKIMWYLNRRHFKISLLGFEHAVTGILLLAVRKCKQIVVTPLSIPTGSKLSPSTESRDLCSYCHVGILNNKLPYSLPLIFLHKVSKRNIELYNIGVINVFIWPNGCPVLWQGDSVLCRNTIICQCQTVSPSADWLAFLTSSSIYENHQAS